MIGVVDYRAGNLASVSNILERLGVEYRITSSASVLDKAKGVIFPGVGHAEAAMRELEKTGMDAWIKEMKAPLLGICLGMQLLYESTTEGSGKTLGVIPGHLEKFDPSRSKVPHMGWNTVKIERRHSLMKGLDTGTHFYHVHSYYAPVTEHTVAVSEYTLPFTAVTAHRNFMGVQFHPEKSGLAGERLVRNFIGLALDGWSGN